MPRTRMEDEQRTSGRDQRPADREGGRRVAQRQIEHELGDQPRDELKVPRVRDQQVPRVRQHLDQEDTEILAVDTVPGRDRARDAHQHHQYPEGDHGRQEQDRQAARPAPGRRRRGLREQFAEHPDGAARERRALQACLLPCWSLPSHLGRMGLRGHQTKRLPSRRRHRCAGTLSLTRRVG